MSSTTSGANSSTDRTASKTAARPPGRTVPVVWSFSPVSRMLIGTLNMSTMVVLQNMPAEL